MKNWGLTFGGGKEGLEGYTDADGASQRHQCAISGYAFIIDSGAVSWSSWKQELITLSTTEAEYIASTHAAKEAIWLRNFIGKVFTPLTEPTTLHCDNQSAVAITTNGNFHTRTKHIDIRYHFIQFIIKNGSLKLIYCPTDDMMADTLTKALPSSKAKHFATLLGLQLTLNWGGVLEFNPCQLDDLAWTRSRLGNPQSLLCLFYWSALTFVVWPLYGHNTLIRSLLLF